MSGAASSMAMGMGSVLVCVVVVGMAVAMGVIMPVVVVVVVGVSVVVAVSMVMPMGMVMAQVRAALGGIGGDALQQRREVSLQAVEPGVALARLLVHVEAAVHLDLQAVALGLGVGE